MPRQQKAPSSAAIGRRDGALRVFNAGQTAARRITPSNATRRSMGFPEKLLKTYLPIKMRSFPLADGGVNRAKILKSSVTGRMP